MESLFFIGRFHPLVLHLPIGFLILAFLMEWKDRNQENKRFAPAVGFALLLGTLSALVAAVSGFILSKEGAYDADLLNKHQWLGIGVTLFSGCSYYLHQHRTISENFNRAYKAMLGISILGILLTGHMGGSLTHGENYLAERAPGFLKPILGGSNAEKTSKIVIEDLDNALVFDDLIQPIFEAKCTRCHNATKEKGELLLTSKEAILKGGETGPLFVKGDPKESLMMQRIHLPLEEKKHMPPRGKEQLSKAEIQILEWWISQQASFDKRIGEIERSEEMNEILEVYTQPEEVSPLPEVRAVRESTLDKLRAAGLPIRQIAENSPYLELRIPGQDSLSKNRLKVLTEVRKQLVVLDLSNTNLNDDLLGIVKQFPHLQKLFLQQTDITDKGLRALQNLEFLEYLNLYGTKVSDTGLEQLSNLQRLKKLYLWQTDVSEAGVASLMAQLPDIEINQGISNSIFGDARLKAPLIRADRDIFQDTLTVELAINLKDVEIRYTLDGSAPDSTATLYNEKLVLNKSAKIQAVAYKEGWQPSDVAERQFVRAKYKAQAIQLDKQPNDRYKANGPASLGDFVKGTVRFTDGSWLGYEKSHLTATLDLGASVEVSGVTISALEDPGSWIFFPKGVKVWVSTDGSNYNQVLRKSYPTAKEPSAAKLANFTEQFEPAKARYVRVQVESNLINPPWHPNPGEPCWVFVDEILVE